MRPSGERSRFQVGLSPFSTPTNSSRRRLVSLGTCPCLSRRHPAGSLRPYPCLGPHLQLGKSATFQYSTLTDRSRRWSGQRNGRGLSHHRLWRRRRKGDVSLLWAARNRYYHLAERESTGIPRYMRRIWAFTSPALRKILLAWISH
jgi:hypothetical protein